MIPITMDSQERIESQELEPRPLTSHTRCEPTTLYIPHGSTIWWKKGSRRIDLRAIILNLCIEVWWMDWLWWNVWARGSACVVTNELMYLYSHIRRSHALPSKKYRTIPHLTSIHLILPGPESFDRIPYLSCAWKKIELLHLCLAKFSIHHLCRTKCSEVTGFWNDHQTLTKSSPGQNRY